MFDIIDSIIDASWNTDIYNSTFWQTGSYISGAIIIILVVTFIDLVYRVFSSFWRK